MWGRPVQFYSYAPACDNYRKQQLNNKYLLRTKVTVKPCGTNHSIQAEFGKVTAGRGGRGTPEATYQASLPLLWETGLLHWCLWTAHDSFCFLSTDGGCSWFSSTSTHHHQVCSPTCLQLDHRLWHKPNMWTSHTSEFISSTETTSGTTCQFLQETKSPKSKLYFWQFPPGGEVNSWVNVPACVPTWSL